MRLLLLRCWLFMVLTLRLMPVGSLTRYIWFILTRLAQACCRSLIVDTLPISQQQLGSAWGEFFYTYVYLWMLSF